LAIQRAMEAQDNPIGRRDCARAVDSGDHPVEGRMSRRAFPVALAFDGRSAASAPVRSPARRAVLLIGTSILVYAAVPTAARAQDECGAPPPGGGTVTCPPSNNPYPNGITYNGAVEDLTVVLEPTVTVSDTVQLTSSTAYVDLRIEGRTDTSIGTTISGAPGVSMDAGFGTAYVGVDSVSTNQSHSRGITADSSDGTTIFVNDIVTSGKYSGGIVATVSGPSAVAEAQPLVDVHSGTISTSGKYSDGITATNPIGSVSIASDSITTTGSDSRGITAGASGLLSITSESISTSNARS